MVPGYDDNEKIAHLFGFFEIVFVSGMQDVKGSKGHDHFLCFLFLVFFVHGVVKSRVDLSGMRRLI